MEFTEEDLRIIYTVLEININAVEFKKGHKSKNDILAVNSMKKVVEKIDKYLEDKK